MSDAEKREVFWMETYKLVLQQGIKLHMKSKDADELSALATYVANNAVKDFRSTDAFK